MDKPPIIPRSDGWKHALASAISDSEELLATVQLPPSDQPAGISHNHFPLRVPLDYVAKMERGNGADPLLRQVLPVAEEALHNRHFCTDPVGDQQAIAEQGLLHKYRGRALLITTGGCAIHCRFCFRRHFPYRDHIGRGERWRDAFDYLARHHDIEELILSGGDPLLLDDSLLGELIHHSSQIPHLQRLRIHTRVPVVLAERITETLLELLSRSRLEVVVVIHCNHPNELAGQTLPALEAMWHSGLRLLNQSVLLKGVNDSPETLAELSHRLFSHRVHPYYLHQLDRVTGASHFEVSDQRALEIEQQLRTMVPGYLLPRLVREVAGEESKRPLV